MTIDEIVTNFRYALRALLPFVEHAGIAWQREDAYDEWDEIAASLFKGLVCEPLRWTLPEPERDRFALPPYDLLLERYMTPTTIDVTIDGSAARRVFHALGTQHEPFDVCECRVVDEQGVPASDKLESHPLESIHFRLRHRTEDGSILMRGGTTDASVDGPDK